jgi:phenylalanyl-tRNA synthetase beta chain
MKLSLNWLSDYVELSDVDLKELCNRITLSTCEIEEIAPAFPGIETIVAARIESTRRHPEADRLQLCTIKAGKFSGEIVCGAPNARPGIVVPFAGVGSKIPGKDGAGLVIAKAKIRGIESEGMLCAASELGLEKIFPGEGLLELDTSLIEPGQKLTELVPQDTVLTIDNKSITNRPDLWCHFGFARELSAILRRKLKKDPLVTKTRFKADAQKKEIHIEKGAALAYFGAVAGNVEVRETPLWMRARLAVVGQKSINNIVDVSNYVMLELGQPNHAFDLNSLRESAVTVAPAKTHNVKKFKTLDGVERELPEEAVVIFDGTGKSARPVALGGIMGGEDSAIQPSTKQVFIESATFPRETIRRTLKKVDLRTDSAMRFEKGQDPMKAAPAVLRIAELLKETCPDLTLGPVHGPALKPVHSKLQVTLEYLRSRLGFEITKKEVETTLSWLGFEIKADEAGKKFTIKAPTWRSQYDVTMPEDIVEELGRVHGYDHIAPRPAPVPVRGKSLDFARLLDRSLRDFLAARGFNETMNYSFCLKEDNEVFGHAGISIRNPVSGLTHLRVSLIPGLLRQAALNQHRYTDVNLFEASRVYAAKLHPDSVSKDNMHASGPAREEKRFAVLRVLPERMNIEGQEEELVKFRETIRTLLSVTARSVEFKPADRGGQVFHPAAHLSVILDGRTIGQLGIAHPLLQEAYDLKRAVLLCDFSFDLLSDKKVLRSYTPPSSFPDSLFDLTVVMDEEISSAKPRDVVLGLKEKEILSVELVSIYRGEPIPEGKKAASYRVRLRKQDGTLSESEWKPIHERSMIALENAGLPLRK